MRLTSITKTRSFRNVTKGVALVLLFVIIFSPQTASADTQAACEARGGDWRLSTVGILTGSYACYGVGGSPLPEGEDQTALRQLMYGDEACNSVGSCIAYVVYIFMVGLGSGAAYLGANFFNIAVHMSLQSVGYGLEFITTGWTQTRDLANMAFIFVLIYIAFTIMLKAETHGTMQMLARVVVIALLINFSFFLVRVVIDGGNILATQFYNSIEAPIIKKTADGSGAQGLAASIFGPEGTKDLTASIMNAVDVTNILNTKSFETFAKGSGVLTEAITLAVIYIALGAILFLLAAIFLTVGIKFMIRTVVLWLAIIAAPLAMVMFTIPGNAKKYYGMWQHAVIAWALYPAVFLFIFLQVSAFTDALAGCPTGAPNQADCSLAAGIFRDLGQNSQDLGGFATLIQIITSVGLRLGLIVLLLFLTLKASDMISAWGGNFAHNIGSWAQGKMIGATKFSGGLYARGLAAGTGYGLRNTVGRAGMAASRWATAREGAGKPLGLGWQAFRGAGDFLGNRTFDPRNAPGGTAVLGLGGLVNVGKGAKGGIIERAKKATDRKVKYGESLEPTPGEKEAAQRKAEKEYDYANTKRTLDASQERIKGLAAQGKEGSEEMQNARRALKTNADRFKDIEDKVKARAKELSGEGNKKVYAETLLAMGALGRGAFFRASQEAGAKLAKGKSGKEKAKEALKALEEEDGGGGDDNNTPPTPGGGGTSGTGGGGHGSTSATGTAGTGGGGIHGPTGLLDSNLEAEMHKQTTILGRIEKSLRRNIESQNSKIVGQHFETAPSNDNVVGINKKDVQGLKDAISDLNEQRTIQGYPRFRAAEANKTSKPPAPPTPPTPAPPQKNDEDTPLSKAA